MFKEYKQIKRCFTLVELLVAMAVFSVMLLLMMQFFSGAQRIWVSTEQKNNPLHTRPGHSSLHL